MIRRPRRSIPAVVVAVVILAACVGMVYALVQSLLGQTPWLGLSQVLGVTSGQRWSDAAVVAVAVVVAAIGLVLLLAALRPGKPTVLPLARLTGPDGTAMADAGVRRASLVKDLTSTVQELPGVASAKVNARRGTVTAQITTAAADPDAVPGEVRQRLEERLGEIGPARRPRVRVRASRDRNS